MKPLPTAKAKEKKPKIWRECCFNPFSDRPVEMIKVVWPIREPMSYKNEDYAAEAPKDTSISIQKLDGMDDTYLQTLRCELCTAERHKGRLIMAMMGGDFYDPEEGWFTNTAGLNEPYSSLSQYPPKPIHEYHNFLVWVVWYTIFTYFYNRP